MDKQKLIQFAGQFLLVTGGCLVALWVYDYLNSPSVAAPSTTPPVSTTATASTATTTTPMTTATS